MADPITQGLTQQQELIKQQQELSKQDLYQIYAPLKGQKFEGTLQQTMEMPNTGNPRDVIDGLDSATEDILKGISTSVVNKYGQTVWKGITGPEDSPRFSDYWLWVVCIPGLQVGCKYCFEVTAINVFAVTGHGFTHGVNIYLKRQTNQ